MSNRHRMMMAAAALVLVSLLAGCGGKPMPFPIPESEMPPAPGLLTGETGTWTLPIVRDKPRPEQQ